uniref:Uncharacterized protein n=1 Tax=Cyprinus carpio TaxID=7962 RepID=A0A8C1GCL1_CYPCA
MSGPNSQCYSYNGSILCCYNFNCIKYLFLIDPFSIDINECMFSPSVCGPNANCSNEKGSYNCSCLDGFTASNSSLIIDVDECFEISNVCGLNSICNNTVGSHNCSCKSGYNVTDPNLPINSNNTCTDINECQFSSSVCGPNANCTNEKGSYNCSCVNGFTATNPSLTISINNTCTGTFFIQICLLCIHVIVDFVFVNEALNLDILVSASTIQTWINLNNDSRTDNVSTALLSAIENISSRLTSDNFRINATSIELNRTVTNSTFYSGISSLPNSTTEIQIPEIPVNTPITVIVFTTLDSILPTRDTSSNGSIKSDVRINGDVVVVKVDNKTIKNISFAFDITNQSLGNPQCVFWSFNLDAWDSTGCKAKPYKSKGNGTGKITCECNHTTSFSILMSPFSVDHIALAYITYIGVAISMASLIICLIIETIVWKSTTRNDTSYMRHVSIVNIAVSLLIANICFIIGAAIAEQEQPTSVGRCSPAVFFMHFFYLSLFFWMLMSALLLFYRTVMVLSQMSRAKMMAIAFIVGYGAPLLIAVITVASTAGPQNYISKRNACWLNWLESKALLAFVIPALTIVAINLVVLIVVLYKMLRRGVGAATQPDEKHALVVIARCVAILTPIFGLTWGFGIGTMVSQELGIHVVFALLNSLQVLLSFLTTSLFILTLCEVYILCALFKCSNCNVNNAIIIIFYHCNNPL